MIVYIATVRHQAGGNGSVCIATHSAAVGVGVGRCMIAGRCTEVSRVDGILRTCSAKRLSGVRLRPAGVGAPLRPLPGCIERTFKTTLDAWGAGERPGALYFAPLTESRRRQPKGAEIELDAKSNSPNRA